MSQKHLLLAPLRECLDPIILRRTKKDPRVQLDLPDKIFQDHLCELSDEQVMLYESVIEAILAQESLGINAFARRALFLRAILYLKQICIHPDLFYGNQDDMEVVTSIDETSTDLTAKIKKSIKSRVQQCFRQRSSHADLGGWLQRSGKLSTLQELLLTWRLQSRGILFFSQYIAAAHMIARMVHTAGDRTDSSPRFLHGGLSAQQRTDMVEEFNDHCLSHRSADPCPVMILSLKAGGTGLNLIGADRVVHLDRWWNPAVEDQATDRAHRIGQKSTVFVHTLTSDATLEKSIEQLFIEKRQLAADLLGTASGGDVGDLLKDRGGFLSLVDPDNIFYNRLLAGSGQPPTPQNNGGGPHHA